MLQKHLDGLREPEEQGNRRLFLDDVFIDQLRTFFNPLGRSLRTIEELSRCPSA